MTNADFKILPVDVWTDLDRDALQVGLLALLEKAAEGIAAKTYQTYMADDERECLRVVQEAAQTDRAHLLCRYLTLVVDQRPPHSLSDVR